MPNYNFKNNSNVNIKIIENPKSKMIGNMQIIIYGYILILKMRVV